MYAFLVTRSPYSVFKLAFLNALKICSSVVADNFKKFTKLIVIVNKSEKFTLLSICHNVNYISCIIQSDNFIQNIAEENQL
jgi:hypothetical protein